MTVDQMRNYLKIIALIGLIIFLIWFLGSITWLLGLFAISLVIVYALTPIVDYLKKRFDLSQRISVGIAFLVFLSFFITFLIIVVPITVRQIENIVKDFPRYIVQIQFLIMELEEQLEALEVELDYYYLENLTQYLRTLPPALDSIAHFGMDMVSGLLNVLLVILTVFYLLYDFQNIRQNIVSLCPDQHRPMVQDIIRIIDINFGGYIRGTIIRLFVVGILVGVSMYLIGMPYAFLLGLFAGIMDIFLYIGPYLAAIPAIFLSISPNTPSIILVIIIYVIIQMLESFVISPLLLGKAVKIKPITVLGCLLAGQQVAGIMGLILAVPVAGIIKSLIIYFQEKKGTPEDRMIV